MDRDKRRAPRSTSPVEDAFGRENARRFAQQQGIYEDGSGTYTGPMPKESFTVWREGQVAAAVAVVAMLAFALGIGVGLFLGGV